MQDETVQKLEELAGLLEKKIITREEYDVFKKRLLAAPPPADMASGSAPTVQTRADEFPTSSYPSPSIKKPSKTLTKILLVAIALVFAGTAILFFFGKSKLDDVQTKEEVIEVKEDTPQVPQENAAEESSVKEEVNEGDKSPTQAQLEQPEAKGEDGETSAEFVIREKSQVNGKIKPLITSTQAGEANLRYRITLLHSENSVDSGELARTVAGIQEKASAGTPEAMDQMGYLLEYGRGHEKSSVEAARWYEKAASAGLLEAMNDIGYMYLDGKGVPKNEVTAATWFRKGADLGNPEAMNNLGYMYTKGLGVPKAHAQAAVWYEKAANLGQPHGMKNLGHAYMYGLGVPQDQQVGKKWLLRAAEAGEPNAMYSVGRIFEHGVAGVQDYEEAARWYKKASSLGHDGALRSLANFYKKGLGVDQDLSEAETLLKRAEDIQRQF